MAKVYCSCVINAPVDRVWARIRDFNGLPDWHPAFENSQIEGGQSRDQVGCVRNFHLKAGGNIRERLLALSDDQHLCTYTILESPLPIADYVSTLRLRPVTDGNRTFAEWSSEFGVEPAQKADMEKTIAGVYIGGFEALKKHFGG
jgi:hypothetical protein